MNRNLKILGVFYLAIMSGIVIYSISYPYIIVDKSIASTEPKVAAFYYNWYANDTDFSQTNPYLIEDDSEWKHWHTCNNDDFPTTGCSTFTPRFGWYDSSDPKIMETHLLEAEDAGIDAFICSYWGNASFEFRNIKNMVRAARYLNSNVSISCYFESNMVDVSVIGIEAAQIHIMEQFRAIYDFMTNDTFSDYLWYEDGKPVLFLYVVQTVPAEIWTNVVSTLKNEGKEFFLVADRPDSGVDYNQNFNGIHQYDVYAPTYGGDYMSTFLNHKIVANDYSHLFIAGVAPGYDDHLVRDGNPPLLRDAGHTYQNSWESAIALNPNWITITSWNEWHEGTEVEPSIENEDLALNQTKEFAFEFKSGVYTELQPRSFYFGIIMHSVIALVVTWAILMLQGFWNRKILDVNKWLKLIWALFCLIVGIAAIGYFTVAEVILRDPFEISSTYWMYLMPVSVIFGLSSFRMLSDLREIGFKRPDS